MSSVVFESVSKLFHSRPVLFNWIGRERSGEVFAVRDHELTIDEGEILVILGPNGSGKTTFLIHHCNVCRNNPQHTSNNCAPVYRPAEDYTGAACCFPTPSGCWWGEQIREPRGHET
jgi:ABC-type taurine transport system ATPase subunit